MIVRLLIIIVLISGTSGCMKSGSADATSDDSVNVETFYSVNVESLLEGTPDEETKAAIDTLKSAGIKAYPVLLGYLDDQRKASENFFQRAMVTADGNAYHPRIGSVCFDIVHEQIEGNWPKAYRDYYVLRRDNIREWWAKNKTKSLAELRVQCAREALHRAEAEFGNIDSEHETSVITFLRKHLKEQEQR